MNYHPDILYLHEEGCKDFWLCLEAIWGPRAKKVWETLSYLQRGQDMSVVLRT